MIDLWGTWSGYPQTKTGSNYAHMAPEQVKGGEIAEATDIYAFGALMYEMARC